MKNKFITKENINIIQVKRHMVVNDVSAKHLSLLLITED